MTVDHNYHCSIIYITFTYAVGCVFSLVVISCIILSYIQDADEHLMWSINPSSLYLFAVLLS